MNCYGVTSHGEDAQVSGYPSDGVAANVGYSTTKCEVSEIEGMDTNEFREHNINMLLGRVNALSYGSAMLNMPKIVELMEYLDNQQSTTTYH